jgi:phosphotransferase system  glucose/maltose/N-acetylglucosamine-specific IIC component
VKAIRELRGIGERVLVLTGFLWVAWEAAWASFGGTERLFLALLPAFLLSAFLVVVSWIWLRVRSKSLAQGLSRFARTGLILGVGFYGLLCGLHFVQAPPKQFAFLEGRKPMMSVEPGLPGLVGAAYSFPADFRAVTAEAQEELTKQGYESDAKERALFAWRNSGNTPFTEVSVSISPGRIVGKRWVIDGDMVETESRNDWVTVEVIQPDVFPFWVRMFLP